MEATQNRNRNNEHQKTEKELLHLLFDAMATQETDSRKAQPLFALA